MHRVHVRVLAQRRRRAFILAVAAAVVATTHVWTVAYANGRDFPMVVTDRSCQDVTTDESAQRTDCNPDDPSWSLNNSQVQNVVVAQNVDAPGSAVGANEDQDAPISQLP